MCLSQIHKTESWTILWLLTSTIWLQYFSTKKETPDSAVALWWRALLPTARNIMNTFTSVGGLCIPTSEVFQLVALKCHAETPAPLPHLCRTAKPLWRNISTKLSVYQHFCAKQPLIAYPLIFHCLETLVDTYFNLRCSLFDSSDHLGFHCQCLTKI